MQQLFANPFAMYAETKDRIARNAMEAERFGWERKQQEAEDEKRKWEREQRARQSADRALQGRGAEVRYGPMLSGNRPAMPPQAPQIAPQSQMQAMPPMQGGAPIEPQQPEIDQATGMPIDKQVVQGMRQPQFVASEGIKREMELYAQEGRWDLVGQLAPMYQQAVQEERKAATDQEQQGYDLTTKTLEQFAAWAVNAKPQIAQIPLRPGWENQVNAMVQQLASDLNRQGLDGQYVLDRARIDPGETPQSIAQDLDRMISQLGGEDAIKSRFNTRTENAGGSLLTMTDSGDLIRRDNVSVSPNTAAQVGATIRGQNVSAATARRGQDMTDARARENNVKPPTGYVLNPPPPRGQ